MEGGLPLWIAAVAATALLALSCSRREEDTAGRTNPYDAGGTNFSIDQSPTRIATNAAGILWSDFDFARSTGTLRLRFSAYDPNERYDTLVYTLFLGSSPDSLDSVYEGTDTTFDIGGVSFSETMYFVVRVSDKFDSSIATTGSFAAPDGPPPPPPQWSYADPNYACIPLQWDTTRGATGYRTYRTANLDEPFDMILDTPRTTFSYSYYDRYFYYRDSVPDYATYYYIVSAYNSYGESRSADTLGGRRYYSGLPSVSLYSVSQGTYPDHISLYWTSTTSPYASSYRIYRATNSAGPYREIATVPHAGSSQTMTYNDTVATGDTYYYKIAVFDNEGRGGPSSAYRYGYVSRLPAPSGLSASRGTYATHIAVTWYGVTGAAGYYVYRATSSSGVYVLVDSTTATTYNDSVTSGLLFYYKVAACDSTGKTGQLSTYTYGQLSKLPAPTNISASNGTFPGAVKISWSPVSGATGYIVYRYSGSQYATVFDTLDTVASAEYTDTSASVDTVYYYKIAAYNGRSEGNLSVYAAGRPMYPVQGFWVGYDADYLPLAWSTAVYANGYNVYRRREGDSSFSKLVTITTTSYKDSVPDYALYWYYVTGYTSNGESPASKIDAGIREPKTPENFIAVDSTTFTVLSWTASEGAEKYYVYRSTTTSAVLYDSTKATTYLDSNVVGVDRYNYWVSAYNGGGESPRTGSVSGGKLAVPRAPLSFAAAGNQDYIGLTWAQNLTGSRATGFYVYRAPTSSGTYTKIATVADTFYHDTVSNGAVHYYKVSAYNSLGEGPQTGSVYAARSAPSVPTGLVAGRGTSPLHVALSWHPTSGADGYNVYRSTSTTSASFTRIAGTTDTSFADSSAVVSTSYYYKVAAYSDIGESAQSGYASGWILSPPSRPTVVGTVAHISVQWTAALTADGYGVYRSANVSGPYSRIDSTASGIRIVYDTVTSPGPHYYKLSSYYGQLESELSAASDPVSRVFPSSPTWVTATDGTLSDTIRVTWPAVNGADGYRVFRDTVLGFTNATLVGAAAGTMWYDPVSTDRLYLYRVKAYNGAGESVLSPADSGFRRPSSVPDAPENVRASDTSAAFIRVWWSRPSAGSHLNGYTVYRSTTETGTYSFVDSTQNLFYQDIVPLTLPTYYWYRIKAFNSVGEGAFSAAVSGTRQ